MARPIKLRRRVDMRNLDVPADVVAVEKAMETVGYYEPPVFGTGRSALWDLDDAIRRLQTDRGLKSDGGGRTIRAPTPRSPRRGASGWPSARAE